MEKINYFSFKSLALESRLILKNSTKELVMISDTPKFDPIEIKKEYEKLRFDPEENEKRLGVLIKKRADLAKISNWEAASMILNRMDKLTPETVKTMIKSMRKINYIETENNIDELGAGTGETFTRIVQDFDIKSINTDKDIVSQENKINLLKNTITKIFSEILKDKKNYSIRTITGLKKNIGNILSFYSGFEHTALLKLLEISKKPDSKLYNIFFDQKNDRNKLFVDIQDMEYDRAKELRPDSLLDTSAELLTNNNIFHLIAANPIFYGVSIGLVSIGAYYLLDYLFDDRNKHINKAKNAAAIGVVSSTVFTVASVFFGKEISKALREIGTKMLWQKYVGKEKNRLLKTGKKRLKKEIKGIYKKTKNIYENWIRESRDYAVFLNEFFPLGEGGSYIKPSQLKPALKYRLIDIEKKRYNKDDDIRSIQTTYRYLNSILDKPGRDPNKKTTIREELRLHGEETIEEIIIKLKRIYRSPYNIIRNKYLGDKTDYLSYLGDKQLRQRRAYDSFSSNEKSMAIKDTEYLNKVFKGSNLKYNTVGVAKRYTIKELVYHNEYIDDKNTILAGGKNSLNKLSALFTTRVMTLKEDGKYLFTPNTQISKVIRVLKLKRPDFELSSNLEIGKLIISKRISISDALGFKSAQIKLQDSMDRVTELRKENIKLAQTKGSKDRIKMNKESIEIEISNQKLLKEKIPILKKISEIKKEIKEKEATLDRLPIEVSTKNTVLKREQIINELVSLNLDLDDEKLKLKGIKKGIKRNKSIMRKQIIEKYLSDKKNKYKRYLKDIENKIDIIEKKLKVIPINIENKEQINTLKSAQLSLETQKSEYERKIHICLTADSVINIREKTLQEKIKTLQTKIEEKVLKNDSDTSSLLKEKIGSYNEIFKTYLESKGIEDYEQFIKSPKLESIILSFDEAQKNKEYIKTHSELVNEIKYYKKLDTIKHKNDTVGKISKNVIENKIDQINLKIYENKREHLLFLIKCIFQRIAYFEDKYTVYNKKDPYLKEIKTRFSNINDALKKILIKLKNEVSDLKSQNTFINDAVACINSDLFNNREEYIVGGKIAKYIVKFNKIDTKTLEKFMHISYTDLISMNAAFKAITGSLAEKGKHVFEKTLTKIFGLNKYLKSYESRTKNLFGLNKLSKDYRESMYSQILTLSCFLKRDIIEKNLKDYARNEAVEEARKELIMQGRERGISLGKEGKELSDYSLWYMGDKLEDQETQAMVTRYAKSYKNWSLQKCLLVLKHNGLLSSKYGIPSELALKKDLLKNNDTNGLLELYDREKKNESKMFSNLERTKTLSKEYYKNLRSRIVLLKKIRSHMDYTEERTNYFLSIRNKFSRGISTIYHSANEGTQNFLHDFLAKGEKKITGKNMVFDYISPEYRELINNIDPDKATADELSKLDKLYELAMFEMLKNKYPNQDISSLREVLYSAVQLRYWDEIKEILKKKKTLKEEDIDKKIDVLEKEIEFWSKTKKVDTDRFKDFVSRIKEFNIIERYHYKVMNDIIKKRATKTAKLTTGGMDYRHLWEIGKTGIYVVHAFNPIALAWHTYFEEDFYFDDNTKDIGYWFPHMVMWVLQAREMIQWVNMKLNYKIRYTPWQLYKRMYTGELCIIEVINEAKKMKRFYEESSLLIKKLYFRDIFLKGSKLHNSLAKTNKLYGRLFRRFEFLFRSSDIEIIEALSDGRMPGSIAETSKSVIESRLKSNIIDPITNIGGIKRYATPYKTLRGSIGKRLGGSNRKFFVHNELFTISYRYGTLTESQAGSLMDRNELGRLLNDLLAKQDFSPGTKRIYYDDINNVIRLEDSNGGKIYRQIDLNTYKPATHKLKTVVPVSGSKPKVKVLPNIKKGKIRILDDSGIPKNVKIISADDKALRKTVTNNISKIDINKLSLSDMVKNYDDILKDIDITEELQKMFVSDSDITTRISGNKLEKNDIIKFLSNNNAKFKTDKNISFNIQNKIIKCKIKNFSVYHYIDTHQDIFYALFKTNKSKLLDKKIIESAKTLIQGLDKDTKLLSYFKTFDEPKRIFEGFNADQFNVIAKAGYTDPKIFEIFHKTLRGSFFSNIAQADAYIDLLDNIKNTSKKGGMIPLIKKWRLNSASELLDLMTNLDTVKNFMETRKLMNSASLRFSNGFMARSFVRLSNLIPGYKITNHTKLIERMSIGGKMSLTFGSVFALFDFISAGSELGEYLTLGRELEDVLGDKETSKARIKYNWGQSARLLAVPLYTASGGVQVYAIMRGTATTGATSSLVLAVLAVSASKYAKTKEIDTYNVMSVTEWGDYMKEHGELNYVKKMIDLPLGELAGVYSNSISILFPGSWIDKHIESQFNRYKTQLESYLGNEMKYVLYTDTNLRSYMYDTEEKQLSYFKELDILSRLIKQKNDKNILDKNLDNEIKEKRILVRKIQDSFNIINKDKLKVFTDIAMQYLDAYKPVPDFYKKQEDETEKEMFVRVYTGLKEKIALSIMYARLKVYREIAKNALARNKKLGDIETKFISYLFGKNLSYEINIGRWSKLNINLVDKDFGNKYLTHKKLKEILEAFDEDKRGYGLNKIKNKNPILYRNFRLLESNEVQKYIYLYNVLLKHKDKLDNRNILLKSEYIYNLLNDFYLFTKDSVTFDITQYDAKDMSKIDILKMLQTMNNKLTQVSDSDYKSIFLDFAKKHSRRFSIINRLQKKVFKLPKNFIKETLQTPLEIKESFDKDTDFYDKSDINEIVKYGDEYRFYFNKEGELFYNNDLMFSAVVTDIENTKAEVLLRYQFIEDFLNEVLKELKNKRDWFKLDKDYLVNKLDDINIYKNLKDWEKISEWDDKDKRLILDIIDDYEFKIVNKDIYMRNIYLKYESGPYKPDAATIKGDKDILRDYDIKRSTLWDDIPLKIFLDNRKDIKVMISNLYYIVDNLRNTKDKKLLERSEYLLNRCLMYNSDKSTRKEFRGKSSITSVKKYIKDIDNEIYNINTETKKSDITEHIIRKYYFDHPEIREWFRIPVSYIKKQLINTSLSNTIKDLIGTTEFKYNKNTGKFLRRLIKL